jgi:hypothetical protein
LELCQKGKKEKKQEKGGASMDPVRLKSRDWALITRLIKPLIQENENRICLFDVLRKYFPSARATRKKIKFFAAQGLFEKLPGQKGSDTKFRYKYTDKPVVSEGKELSKVIRFFPRGKKQIRKRPVVKVKSGSLEAIIRPLQSRLDQIEKEIKQAKGLEKERHRIKKVIRDLTGK